MQRCLILAAGCWLISTTLASAQVAHDGSGAIDGFARAAQVKPPTAAEVKSLALAWLRSQQASPQIFARARALWESEPQTRDALLYRFVETIALADNRVARLQQFCVTSPRSVILPDTS